MNIIVKESAKNKVGVKKLTTVVNKAREKKTGMFAGINFKTFKNSIILF